MKTKKILSNVLASAMFLGLLMTSSSVRAIDIPDTNINNVEDPVLKKNSGKIDSLKIVKMPNGKYYVVCTVCPLTLSTSSLQIPILDSLKFIDPAIPINRWVATYVIKDYIFNSRQHRSKAEFKNWHLVINNRFTETHAVLVNDSLKIYKAYNLQGNSAQKGSRGGKLAMILLFIIGAFIGLLTLVIKKMWLKITVVIVFVTLVTSLLFLIMLADENAKIAMIIIQLSGILPTLLFWNWIKRIERKKPATS